MSRLRTAYLELTQRCRRRARQHTPARDTVGHTVEAATNQRFPTSLSEQCLGAARGSPDRAGSRLRLRSDDSTHSARFQPLSRRACVRARCVSWERSEPSSGRGDGVCPSANRGPWALLEYSKQQGTFSWKPAGGCRPGLQVRPGPGPQTAGRRCFGPETLVAAVHRRWQCCRLGHMGNNWVLLKRSRKLM